MPALNGVVSSPTPEHATQDVTLKRKRNESEASEDKSNEQPSKLANSKVSAEAAQESIGSLWQVLQRHDASPSIFDHLPSTSTEDTNGSDGRTSKRAKLSNPSSAETIASKVNNKSYSSIEEFASDVDAVADTLLHAAKANAVPRNGTHHWMYTADMFEQDRRIADINSFRKKFYSLLAQETYGTSAKQLTNGHLVPKENADADVKTREDTAEVDVKRSAGAEQDGRTVLTLFGNAQGHKQLFSSFQKPLGEGTKAESGAYGPNEEIGPVDVTMPLRETGLPPGITSTKIVSTAPENTYGASIRVPTFLEAFPPPASLPPLSPPRTPKPIGLHGSAITWTHGASAYVPGNQTGFTREKLRTGQWLGYGGLAPAEEPTSPEAKRKQRDRALSTGEASWIPSDGAVAAQMQAKEEALFRSVYSSFAPTRDNSSALVSEETKADVWWDRHGKQFFDEVFAIDPALEDQSDLEAETTPTYTNEDELAAFKEAVENFEPYSLESLKSANDGLGGPDHELEKLSEMLETLHSYQRIRQSSLTPSSRTPMSRNTLMHDQPGDASTPSAAEIETYNSLKSQFAKIVSTLPPYAVAKLNGDQLADLNVSRSILMESKVYKGVMEEDPASRLVKAAALSAAVGNMAPHARQNPALTPHYSQSAGHARTAQMTQPSRATGQAGQYFGASTVPRPGSNYSRQPLSNWQTPAQYHQHTQRHGYPGQQGYGQQTSRPVTGSRPPPLAQFAQRPSNPPLQPNGNYQSPSQPQYQQRAQGSWSNYNSYGGAVSPPRTGQYQGSPQSQQYSPPAPQQQRYGYSQSQGQGSPRQHNFSQQQQQHPQSNYQAQPLQQPRPQSSYSSSPRPPSAPTANMSSASRPETPAGSVESQPPRPQQSPFQPHQTQLRPVHVSENEAASIANGEAPTPTPPLRETADTRSSVESGRAAGSSSLGESVPAANGEATTAAEHQHETPADESSAAVAAQPAQTPAADAEPSPQPERTASEQPATAAPEAVASSA